MLRRETINNSRVPVVQDGSQVDQEHHRGAGIVRPELPIRELHSAGRDRPRWAFFDVTFRFGDALMIPSLRR